MSFGGFSNHSEQSPIAEINVTPMVDVMLVLLVIFIITAPMFTQAVRLDLPKASAAPSLQKPETIRLSVDAQGVIFWNQEVVAESELPSRFASASKQTPQPELQLRADKSTRYEVIAKVMAAAQTNGLSKLGFVTDPN